MRDHVKPPKQEILILFTVLFGLIVLRLPHLLGPIDGPHSFRQCDVAFCAWDFYQHGIDLFHPTVCWMGAYKTTIFNFPLPEALMAAGYFMFGESILWARLVHLTFFIGAAGFFYLIIQRAYNCRIALFATMVYGLLPLGLFYSRAVYADFAAIFFAHGMLYGYLIGIAERRKSWLLFASLMGALAFLIKAPYAFYFALPIFVLLFSRFDRNIVVTTIASAVIPVSVFILWRGHVNDVNSAAPDWYQIPHFRKITNMGSWYFGTAGARWNVPMWRDLGQRIVVESTGRVGLCLFLMGLIVSLVRRKGESFLVAHGFFWAWMVGACIYLFLFPTLNWHHNYYQNPLLAMIALPAGICIEKVRTWCQPKLRRLAWAPVMLLFIVLAADCIAIAEERFYFKDDMNEIGNLIRNSTVPESLMVASWEGATQLEPRMLYAAHRFGWSIQTALLDDNTIGIFRDLGADYLAIAVTEIPENISTLLSKMGGRIYELTDAPWKLVLIRINVGISSEKIIRKLYREILSRDPAPEELATLVRKYDFHSTGLNNDNCEASRNLTIALFSSAEYGKRKRTDQEFLHDLRNATSCRPNPRTETDRKLNGPNLDRKILVDRVTQSHAFEVYTYLFM